MKNFSVKIEIGIFTLIIGLFFVLNLVLPDKEFSQNENRYLAKAPAFSVNAFFSGKFTADFESYVTDQFFARDTWISLKSTTERLSGKTENNGVFFCADDTLISRFSKPDDVQVSTNIAALNSFCEKAEVPVFFSLIPGAVKIWEEKLPRNAVNYDQKALIESIYSQLNSSNISVYDVLKKHKNEYIYYRTDHHLTTLGAYYAYFAHAKAMGITPNPLDSFVPETVSDDFYGTVYSSSGVRWTAPDTIEVFVSDKGFKLFGYEAGNEVSLPVYDYSYLEKKDKYSMFLGGNAPVLKAVSKNFDAPKLLILRDSYTDAELPFLLSHFSEIHLIDLRYFLFSVNGYIKENGIDIVLVNYGVTNFVSDNNMFKVLY